MSSSTSHKSRPHGRGAHGGHGGGDGSHGGGGGGGGGGEGPLVKVAFARNQAEAEMLQALLLESDIPSVLKRSRGFDAPEFMAAGPHDVFVASTMASRAREVLADTMIDETEERAELDDQAHLERDGTDTSARRLALWLIVAVVAAAVLVWVLYQLS
jgi:hypothetical protein